MQELNLELIRTWLVSQFPDIIAAYLFGSYASGEALESSDIDIAIVLPRKIPPYDLWNHSQELAILLNQDVDMINMTFANTILQFQIISNGKLILSLNDEKRMALENRAILNYLDFTEARQRVIQGYIDRRVING
jgi:predicted nucleotidyltransferase